MKTLQQKLDEISPERQKKIAVRTRELVAREMSLQELRHAVNKTQKTVARTLNMGQDGISRLEKRSDLLLSTLRNYVEAVGGSLTLVAKFPNKEPIAIGGLGEIVLAEEKEKAKRRAAHARQKMICSQAGNETRGLSERSQIATAVITASQSPHGPYSGL
jgi:transcriptional regulator with XRE-family HTH domain